MAAGDLPSPRAGLHATASAPPGTGIVGNREGCEGPPPPTQAGANSDPSRPGDHRRIDAPWSAKYTGHDAFATLGLVAPLRGRTRPGTGAVAYARTRTSTAGGPACRCARRSSPSEPPAAWGAGARREHVGSDGPLSTLMAERLVLPVEP